MLVLTRKLSEAIQIGGGIDAGGVEIVVLKMQGNRVRLGIRAPASTTIRRNEGARPPVEQPDGMPRLGVRPGPLAAVRRVLARNS